MNGRASTAYSRIRRNLYPLPPSLKLRYPGAVAPKPEVGLRSLSVAAQDAIVLRPGPQKPRIVSSAHGPIRQMLLTYPSYAQDQYSYGPVYRELIARLPSSTRFIILTHREVLTEVEQILDSAGAASRATLIEAPEHLHFLVWAQDPYVVVQDVGVSPVATFLIEPFTFPRVGDALIADLVSEATPIDHTQSPLYFQGGNLLIGDRFVLLGADYPAKTAAIIQQFGHIRVPDGVDTARHVRDLYRQTFAPDFDLFYVGTSLPVPQYRMRRFRLQGEEWAEELFLGTGVTQPIFHIDMFLSLAGRSRSGRYRVLVGSPIAADRILDRPPVSHSIPEVFDSVARNLTRQGFEVVRNPLPITYVDDLEFRVRTWYFATSNNCLVQIDPGSGNHVWLPTYGHGDWADLAATDEENARIWDRLGFEVHFLPDFHPFAQNLGSLHCLTKYLDRGEGPP